MFSDNEREVPSPCAVSKEFVQKVASLAPEMLMNGDNININRTLFLLGFDLSYTGDFSNQYGKQCYTVFKDVMIRNPAMPSKVYKTDIYNGQLRNEVDYVVDGKVTYKNQKHYLERVYMDNEIITIDTIPEDVLTNIVDVGIKQHYDYGMQADERAMSSTKPSRNVVRK